MIDSFKGKYAFLSNFYKCNITEKLDDDTVITYPTSEHAFQAAKTLDKQLKERISKEVTPGDAKRAGGRKGYITLRDDWEQVKDAIMLDILRQKFSSNPLKQRLLETGSNELVEGNTWNDDYWGVCTYNGKNMLGKLLMQVRAELQAQ